MREVSKDLEGTSQLINRHFRRESQSMFNQIKSFNGVCLFLASIPQRHPEAVAWFHGLVRQMGDTAATVLLEDSAAARH